MAHQAYQNIPRFHVSDVQSPEEDDVLEEEPAGGGVSNSSVKCWIAASAALLFIAGGSVAAPCALNRYKTATRKDYSSGTFLQRVNFEAPILLTCMACVTQGRSWQMGACNPTKECPMTHRACYEDANGCEQWQEQVEAEHVCETQADCASCVSNNQLCFWSDDAGCFTGVGYLGPLKPSVVRQGETCSAPKTAEIATTAEPKNRLSSNSFLKPSQDILAECVACVRTGASWLAGECNPLSKCMVEDKGCFQDALGCEKWHEERKAASKCEAQNDCASCLGSNNQCAWYPNAGCFLGSGFFWEPPEGAVQQGEKCPGNEAVTLLE